MSPAQHPQTVSASRRNVQTTPHPGQDAERADRRTRAILESGYRLNAPESTAEAIPTFRHAAPMASR